MNAGLRDLAGLPASMSGFDVTPSILLFAGQFEDGHRHDGYAGQELGWVHLQPSHAIIAYSKGYAPGEFLFNFGCVFGTVFGEYPDGITVEDGFDFCVRGGGEDVVDLSENGGMFGRIAGTHIPYDSNGPLGLSL